MRLLTRSTFRKRRFARNRNQRESFDFANPMASVAVIPETPRGSPRSCPIESSSKYLQLGWLALWIKANCWKPPKCRNAIDNQVSDLMLCFEGCHCDEIVQRKTRLQPTKNNQLSDVVTEATFATNIAKRSDAPLRKLHAKFLRITPALVDFHNNGYWN